MIDRKKTATGCALTTKPFSAPNENQHCEIVCEVTVNARQGSVQMRINHLRWMTLADAAILSTALRAVSDEATEQISRMRKRIKPKAKK